MGRARAVGAAAQWDQRRNSSLVIPPPPNALPDALAALRRFRETNPALHRWITDGHPLLTDAEHVERFGEPYRPLRSSPRKGG